MAETRSLHRKLAQIFYEAERIPKRGKAPAAMGGYPFVQVGDAADYIRKELGDKVLTMMPTAIDVVGQQDRPTKAGGTMTTLDLRVEWTISDGESGESIKIVSYGAGADGGDKYSGKAMTNAMKYALLSGFLLSTGDDVELGTEEAGRAKREPAAATAARESFQERQAVNTRPDEPTLIGPWSGAGVIEIHKSGVADGSLHPGPDGSYYIVYFKTTEGTNIPQVLVQGTLAMDILDAAGQSLNGLACELSGDLYSVPYEKGEPGTAGYFSRPFQRLHLKHIRTAGWSLPVPVQTGPGLFDAEAESELDAIPL